MGFQKLGFCSKLIGLISGLLVTSYANLLNVSMSWFRCVQDNIPTELNIIALMRGETKDLLYIKHLVVVNHFISKTQLLVLQLCDGKLGLEIRGFQITLSYGTLIQVKVHTDLQ